METSIIRGNYEHLENCAGILEDSILGQKYFLDQHNQYIGKRLLKEGFEKEKFTLP